MAKKWLVKFSPAKTKTITFTWKLSPMVKLILYLDNEDIVEVDFQQSGEWRLHIQTII